MRPLRLAAGIFVAVLFLTMTGYLRSQDAKVPDAKVIDARRQELKQLLADEWEYELRESPELGTIIGDYRYNDRWSDVSLAHTARQKQDSQRWLTRFEAIDPTGFPEQEKLNRSLMVRNLKEQLEGIDLKLYEMPVEQFFGLHLFLAQFVALAPFDSTKHYEDYVARLHQMPRVICCRRPRNNACPSPSLSAWPTSSASPSRIFPPLCLPKIASACTTPS